MSRTDGAQARYEELLEYEFANRTFAYISTRKIAEMRKGTPMGDFYEAYHALEIHNRSVYDRMKVQLQCDCALGWFARSRGQVMGWLGGFVGGGTDILESIVIRYLPKLEELRELADPQHRAFFDYVVAQETVQLEAARAVSDNGWDAGA